ncbi:MAG TPA: glutamate-1-semialdehyde 2,1-aminomutase [Nitrososphaeraceae archaeon]|nr:glutamate-1-semialdehyde 2,1-aminomutase [Nitrososphaeraceae archaeon]
MYDNSRNLYQRATRVLPGGVNSPIRFFKPFPFFAASASGSKIVSIDHLSYLDYCMGYGSLILGHANAEIIEAVKSQLANGSLYCIPTENEVKLAELIRELIPACEMTRIVNSGMEATMNAIKLARAYTNRKKVIKFEGCYHGAHDYSLVNRDETGYGTPSSNGIPKEFSLETLVIPFNDILALEEVVRERDDISCIILEPVPANMGLVVPEKEYLNQIRRIALENNILLIFDEVITGFRLAIGGASEFFGIKPDIVTFSKSIGNGFPLAAICGRRDILEQLSPSGDVYQASTYAGNPASVTAGLATISTLAKDQNQIYPRITRICDSLVDGIREVIHDRKIPYCLNNVGSMYQLFFTSQDVRDMTSAKTSNPEMFTVLFRALLDKEIFIPPSQFETCFLSCAHVEEDIDRTIEGYDYAFRMMRAAI